MAWHDPSPHAVRFVRVDSGTRLETLDWGGRGPTIVLLAGLGNSAHVFDDFAPRLTDRFHVLGITRRGFGASSQPPATEVGVLVSDIAAVLDSLGVQRAILIGHSIAGDELTAFAATHPDRTTALVYLDAAYDRSGYARLLQTAPIPPQPPMTAADSASPAAVGAYVDRIFALRLPPAEIRATTRFDSAGRYAGDVTSDPSAGGILEHLPHPAYGRVKCPALAIYAVSDSVQLIIPYYAELDSAGRQAARRVASVVGPFRDAAIGQFKHDVANSEVLEIPGANHYVFLSNEVETLDAVRTFLARTVGDASSK
jgi:pimeloyl-ACP methyl ester carboxylesterase